MMAPRCRAGPPTALRLVFVPSSNITGATSQWQPCRVLASVAGVGGLWGRRCPHHQFRRGMASRPDWTDGLWNGILPPEKATTRPAYEYGLERDDRQGARGAWDPASRNKQGAHKATSPRRGTAHGSGSPAGGPSADSSTPNKLSREDVYKILLSRRSKPGTDIRNGRPGNMPSQTSNPAKPWDVLDPFSPAFADTSAATPAAGSAPGSTLGSHAARQPAWTDDGRGAGLRDQWAQAPQNAEETDWATLGERIEARKRSERARLIGSRPRNDDIRHRGLVHIRFDQDPVAGKLSRPYPIADLLQTLDMEKYAIELLTETASPQRQAMLRQKAEEQRRKKELEPGAHPADNDAVVINWLGEHPICHIVHLGTESKIFYERLKKEAIKLRKADKPEADKEIEINWGIEQHDLAVRLRRLKAFLQKGLKVEIRLVNKARKARASVNKRVPAEEEAEALLQALRDTRRAVSGSEESRPEEGTLLDAYKLFFRGPKIKKVKKVKKVKKAKRKGAGAKSGTVLDENNEEEENDEEETDEEETDEEETDEEETDEEETDEEEEEGKDVAESNGRDEASGQSRRNRVHGWGPQRHAP